MMGIDPDDPDADAPAFEMIEGRFEPIHRGRVGDRGVLEVDVHQVGSGQVLPDAEDSLDGACVDAAGDANQPDRLRRVVHHAHRHAALRSGGRTHQRAMGDGPEELSELASEWAMHDKVSQEVDVHFTLTTRS